MGVLWEIPPVRVYRERERAPVSRYEYLNFWSGLTHRIAYEKGRGHARGGAALAEVASAVR